MPPKPSYNAKRLILFDIDGTLLRTGGAGALAFNQVFKNLYGINEAWQDVQPDGKTDPMLIEELFLQHFGRKPTYAEEKTVEKQYIAAMEPALAEASNFRLMPGVPELLAAIKERSLGYLGLATGNYESTAMFKLEKAGLRDYFAFGGYGSHSRVRRELTRRAFDEGLKLVAKRIDGDDVIVVGDTIHDVDCGRHIGAVTVAVATGNTSYETLKRSGADFVLESFADLESALLPFY